MIQPSTIVYVTPKSPSSTITPYRSLVRHTPPAVEPVTLEEAKAHCRVDTSDDDTYISSLISLGRSIVEDRLDRTIITTVWEAKYDHFPMWELVLPRPPLRASNITGSLEVTVTYRDEGGTNRTMLSSNADFQVDDRAVPGRIYPNYAAVWPAVRGDENSVTVKWTAGAGRSEMQFEPVCRHAILLLVGHFYANREPVTAGMTSQNVPIPYTFETLMSQCNLGIYR